MTDLFCWLVKNIFGLDLNIMYFKQKVVKAHFDHFELETRPVHSIGIKHQVYTHNKILHETAF